MQSYHLYDHSCTSCGKTDMPAYPHQPDAVSSVVSAARSSHRSLPACSPGQYPADPLVVCRSTALRGSRHGSGPGNCCRHTSSRHAPADGRSHPVCQQCGALHCRLYPVFHLAYGRHRNALDRDALQRPFNRPAKICASPAEQNGPRTIRRLSA